MYQYRPSGFNFLPTVVKNLLIINGLFFLVNLVAESKFQVNINQILGLYNFQSPYFKPYQLITHIFMHGDFMHVFMNMFMLWMFGSTLENVWGPKRFLFYYFFTAFGAALLHQGINFIELSSLQSHVNTFIANPTYETLSNISISANYFSSSQYQDLMIIKEAYNNGIESKELTQRAVELLQHYTAVKTNIPTVGASGAVFGVLLAFGMLFPNTLIYLYFAIPIRAKWVVAGLALIEIFRGLENNPLDNVAHFAHIGGMLFGYILIRYWNKNMRNRFY